MSTRFSLRAANGQEYPITGPFRIGREPECQIQIDNNLVSRIHASIWIDHDHLLLRDERSRNGTQLNGQLLVPGEAHYLHHDDEVRIGDTKLIVVSDPPYPRPRQQRGLSDEPEDEPPPTAPVDKPGPEPAPVPRGALVQPAEPMPMLPARIVAPPSAVPSPAPLSPAAPRRSMALPLVVGGGLALVLLLLCCALGLFAATTGGPALLTALAPPVRRTVTPAAASAADTAHPPTPQPAAEPVAANHGPAGALDAQTCLASACRLERGALPVTSAPEANGAGRLNFRRCRCR